MQIYARDHVEVHQQKKKEVLYLAKKREKYNGLRNVMDINCDYSKNLTNMYFSFITMLYSLIEIMNNVVINNVSRVLAILFINVFSITINSAVRILIIIIYLNAVIENVCM